jgi:hypothetical protein
MNLVHRHELRTRRNRFDSQPPVLPYGFASVTSSEPDVESGAYAFRDTTATPEESVGNLGQQLRTDYVQRHGTSSSARRNM